MRFYGKVRTPTRTVADEDAAMRSPLGVLNVKEADGTVFAALLRELLSRPASRGRRHSRMTVEMELTLVFDMKSDEKSLQLEVPAGSELIRYPGGTFVLRTGMRSLRVNRRAYGIQLTSHNGFRDSTEVDKWRGTAYTWHATTRM
jgi:hypothetical protein